MKRIAWLLLTASLLAGGLGGLVEIEGFEVEVDDVLIETAVVAVAPRLHREAPPSRVRSDDGATRVLQPARPPPLR